jgi:hypothetical protein
LAKTVVTHFSPDLDGIPAYWLLKKFHPEFKDANIAFAPAGGTYNNEPVDSREDIVHVDTGMGKFDHHQTGEFTCGAQLVYEYLVKEDYVSSDDEALGRLVKILTEIDHAYDVYKWCESASDRYEFSLHNILTGWKILHPRQDEKYVDWTIFALEAVYKILQYKVKGEKDLKAGKKFQTRWGEGIAIYTANDSVLEIAIKEGYAVVARKDPAKGYVRITGSTNHGVDFTKGYDILREKDPEATWFLHASKVLIRNGSIRNPQMKPSKLNVDEVIEVLEKA